MKKITYLATACALCIGMTACGGKNNEEKTINNDANTVAEETVATESTNYSEPEITEAETAVEAEETISSEETVAEQTVAEAEPASNANTWFKEAELADFNSKAQSGDIDQMIDAYIWIETVRANMKSSVRNLDESAIAAAVELDKAETEAAQKYDKYGRSLRGAIYKKQNEMNAAQREKFRKADSNSVLFFTSDDMELSEKYNEIYRKIRYGA